MNRLYRNKRGQFIPALGALIMALGAWGILALLLGTGGAIAIVSQAKTIAVVMGVILGGLIFLKLFRR